MNPPRALPPARDLPSPACRRAVRWRICRYLNDAADQRQMSVVNDRSQGGASLADGAFELMVPVRGLLASAPLLASRAGAPVRGCNQVHRRTLEDDRRGVGEPINETIGITQDASPPAHLGCPGGPVQVGSLCTCGVLLQSAWAWAWA